MKFVTKNTSRATMALILLGMGLLLGGCPDGPSTGDGNGAPTPAGDPAEIARPDYERIAVRSDDIDGVTGTDPCGYSLATADRVEILDLLRSRRFEELNLILERYQAAFEEDPFKEDRVIDAYRAFGITDESLAPLLDSWIQASHGHFPAYLARAMYHYELGWESRGHRYAGETSEEQFEGMESHFDEARRDLASALTVDRDLPLVYLLLIFIDTTESNHKALPALLQQAEAAIADSYWVRSAYVMHLLPRWGGSYEALEEYVEASEALVASNPRFELLAGRAAADRGDLARGEAQYEEAIRQYSLALSHGHDRDYFYRRALAFRRDGQYDEALLDLQAALAIQPQDEEALYQSAVVLTRLGRLDEARSSLALAHALDPAHPGYVGDEWEVRQAARALSEGCKLHESGQLDRALALFDIASSLDVTNHEVCYWRGRVYLEQGDHPRALADFQKAVEMEPSHFESYRTIDWLLFQDRRLDEIIGYWNQFLVVQPDHADAHLEIAGTYKHKGDMARAQEHLWRACELGQEEACKFIIENPDVLRFRALSTLPGEHWS